MGRKPHTNAIVGLDVQPGYAAAAKVVVNGRVAVQQGAVISLAPAVMSGGDVADIAGLAAALRELFELSGLDKRVRLGLASSRVVVRLLELPPITDRKDLDAAVRFSAADAMPLPMDQAVLDYQPLDTITTPDGPRLRVVAVAAHRETVSTLLAAVRAAGLRPEGVDLSAFGMIRALHGGPQDAVTLYVNVGGVTNIAVAAGTDCLFTRVTPSGTEAMADALAARRELPTEAARAVMARVGRAGADEPVEGDPAVVADARTILADGAGAVADDVRASLEFYGAREGAEPVTRVVLAGPGAATAGFCEAFSSELGIEVERGLVAEAHPDALAGAGAPVETFAVAAGLAVQEVAA